MDLKDSQTKITSSITLHKAANTKIIFNRRVKKASPKQKYRRAYITKLIKKASDNNIRLLRYELGDSVSDR